MTDGELIARFEAGDLAAGAFRHSDHVRLAWAYLKSLPLPSVLDRLDLGLRTLAARHGRSDLYHETVTWSYVFLIRQRLQSPGADGADWDAFRAANPDLFEGNLGLLRRYYREETLRSDLARRVFLFPDFGAAGMPEGEPSRQPQPGACTHQ